MAADTIQEKTLRILKMAESETQHSYDYFYKTIKDYTQLAEEERAKLSDIKDAIREYERAIREGG